MCGRFEALTKEEVEEIIRSVEQGLGASTDAERSLEAAAERPERSLFHAGKAITATPGSEVSLIVPSGSWAQSQGTCCGSGCTKCPWTKNPLSLEEARLTWGFSVSWQKGRIFNTRIEHAGDAESMWAESLDRRRCIVPARAFYEPHRSETTASPRTGKQIKRQYVFRHANDRHLGLGPDPDLGLGPDPDPAPGSSPWLLMAGVFSGDCFSIVTTQPNEHVTPIHDRMPLVLRPDEVATWLSPHYAELSDRKGLTLLAEPEHSNVLSITQLSLF